MQADDQPSPVRGTFSLVFIFGNPPSPLLTSIQACIFILLEADDTASTSTTLLCIMDPLSVVGLVGNIVQFVDFTGKLISTSVFLYHSGKGALPENTDIETATKHLVLLNTKLKDAATSTGSRELQRLCTSCGDVADELLAALDKVKVKDEPGKWKSVQKALRSVWSKDDIEGLEKRLARFREELNLHIVVEIR